MKAASILAVTVVFIVHVTSLWNSNRKLTGFVACAPEEVQQPALRQRSAASQFQAPHHCGIVFFYHIGCTGGASVVTWFEGRKETNPMFVFWGGKVTKPGKPTPAEKFVKGMNKFVQNITTWKVAHAHHFNYGSNESYCYMLDWKKTVEDQECKWLGVAIIREPVEHSLAKFRYKPKNMTNQEFISLETERHLQLNYFLYNFLDINPWNVSKEEKVTRALDIIDEFYSDGVVLGSNLTNLVETVTHWTGWEMEELPHENRAYKKNLSYAKNDVKTIQQMLRENGDLDFYFALQQKYDPSLSYLKQY